MVEHIELTINHERTDGPEEQQVTAGNGDGVTDVTDGAESSLLLHKKVPVSNGEQQPLVEDELSTSVSIERDTTPADDKASAVCRLSEVKEQLNEVVIWRLRLWMVIGLIFLLILVLIFVSLALCSVVYEDVDDKYDPTTFETPRNFNGSFRLTNQIFTADLLSPTSNQSRALSTQLQQQLSDFYSSSPALGRYFSSAGIHAFRNVSSDRVVAQFWLWFLRPAGPPGQNQLERFTLSRELVYNVLRQALYDQEAETQDPLYIPPASLSMQVADGAVSQQ